MNAWRDLSIKRKLRGVIVLTSTVSLLLACGAFTVYEWSLFRSHMIEELSAEAALIGANSTAAITFRDAKSAQETLGALAYSRKVRSAVIFSLDGEVFASFQHPVSSGGPPIPFAKGGHRFDGDRLLLWRPIVLAGQTIGAIGLSAGLDGLAERLTAYLGLAVVILLAAIAAAVAFASALQGIITAPILRLADTARRVYTEKNFSLREQQSGGDEVGSLVQQFNYMLDQIEQRDEALRRAHDELEERVKVRTAELIAANQAKSAFLASVTHELRTPLTSIIWSSEMLEEEFADEGLERYVPDLKKVIRAGKSLLAIVTEILDFSKIEAGRMEVHSEEFEVRSVIREVMQTAEPLAAKNGNRLDFEEAGSGAVFLEADEQKFRQSLLNLLSNACKFTSGGRVSVAVERVEEEGADLVAVSVSDTGIGIASEKLSKLFQPFSQLDSSESRKFGGTGLGLAVSQGFCNLMGGRIEVQSEPDRGATFTILLPAARPDTESANQIMEKETIA
jgi:signal transduction histidine kinase